MYKFLVARYLPSSWSSSRTRASTRAAIVIRAYPVGFSVIQSPQLPYIKVNTGPGRGDDLDSSDRIRNAVHAVLKYDAWNVYILTRFTPRTESSLCIYMLICIKAIVETSVVTSWLKFLFHDMKVEGLCPETFCNLHFLTAECIYLTARRLTLLKRANTCIHVP